MFNKLLVLLSFVLIILSVSNVTAEWQEKGHVTYIGTTDQDVTLKWNAVVFAEGYEVKANHVEQEVEIAPVQTTLTQLELQIPRTGHYIFKVRACRDNYTLCGEWAESTDPTSSVVNDQPGSWWIYGYLAKPGPIIIE